MIHYSAKNGQCLKKRLASYKVVLVKGRYEWDYRCIKYKRVPDYGQPRCARYTGAMCELSSSKPHEKLYFHTFIKGDPREKSKMIPFSTKGHCTMGHYKSSKGINDEQECLDKCLVETECRFVSFNKGSCERYRGKYCKLTVNKSPDSKLYKTFKKVPIDMEMLNYGRGYCKHGFYAGWDWKGTGSAEECKRLCLSEEQCTFAAFYRGDSHGRRKCSWKKVWGIPVPFSKKCHTVNDATCSRYNGASCPLNNDKGHYTFVKGGKTSPDFEHVADARYCKGKEQKLKGETPEGCAKICHGVSSMFLQGYGECWCQLSSRNGVCDEQVDNFNDKNEKDPGYKLYRYKLQ